MRVREERRRAVEEVGEERAAHGVPSVACSAVCSPSDLAARLWVEEGSKQPASGRGGSFLRWREIAAGVGDEVRAATGWAAETG